VEGAPDGRLSAYHTASGYPPMSIPMSMSTGTWILRSHPLVLRLTRSLLAILHGVNIVDPMASDLHRRRAPLWEDELRLAEGNQKAELWDSLP
jgi:hypothetical protein